MECLKKNLAHEVKIYTLYIVKDVTNGQYHGIEGIELIELLDIIDFHNFMENNHLILTDKEGVQEKTLALNKTILVMRDVAKRPEGVKAGSLKLMGTDGKNTYNNFLSLLEDEAKYKRMLSAVNPYDGENDSRYIADIIEDGIENG